MILSRSLRFLFIKGVKVAGTSVEMALSTICGPDDIITPISPRDERDRAPHNARNYNDDPDEEKAYVDDVVRGIPRALPEGKYYNHMSAEEVEAQFGDISRFEILFVERNPYSKVLSWANWRASARRYNSGGALQSDVAQIQRQIDRGLDSGDILRLRNTDRYRYRGVISTGWRYETLREQFAAWSADKPFHRFSSTLANAGSARRVARPSSKVSPPGRPAASQA